MIEENNDIFRAGGDALVYLAKPMHKKAFVWGHPPNFLIPSPCTHL